jgi:pimeloyl-ACP methyl ester carboxylesterase
VHFPASDDKPRATPRQLGWWVRDREARLAVAQWPNAALIVWLVARVLAWGDLTSLDEATLRGIGTGALLVWALDELLRGASPFRRVLGAVVLGAQLAALSS